jgi:hypothetical protein
LWQSKFWLGTDHCDAWLPNWSKWYSISNTDVTNLLSETGIKAVIVHISDYNFKTYVYVVWCYHVQTGSSIILKGDKLYNYKSNKWNKYNDKNAVLYVYICV